MASSFKFDAIFVDSTIGLNYKQYRTWHISADTVVEFCNKLIPHFSTLMQVEIWCNCEYLKNKNVT